MANANLQIGISQRGGGITNIPMNDATPREVSQAVTATLHGNGTLAAFPDVDAMLSYAQSDDPENEDLAELIGQMEFMADKLDKDLELREYDNDDGQYLTIVGNSGTDPEMSRSKLKQAFGEDV